MRLVETRHLQYGPQLSQILESRMVETPWEACLDPAERDPKPLKPASRIPAFPLLLLKQRVHSTHVLPPCADFMLESSARVLAESTQGKGSCSI